MATDVEPHALCAGMRPTNWKNPLQTQGTHNRPPDKHRMFTRRIRIPNASTECLKSTNLSNPLGIPQRRPMEVRLKLSRATNPHWGKLSKLNCLSGDRLGTTSDLLANWKWQFGTCRFFKKSPELRVFGIHVTSQTVPNINRYIPMSRPRERFRIGSNIPRYRLGESMKVSLDHCVIWPKVFYHRNMRQQSLKFR